LNLIKADRLNWEWLEELSSPRNEEALADLRILVAKGLRYSLLNRVDSSQLEELVEDFTQDSLLRIMDNLDTFRGESKFVTWAAKIAVNVAFSELRRKRWKDVSMEALLPEKDGVERESALSFLKDPQESPEEKISQELLLEKVEHIIQHELSERQRTVLLAMINEDTSVEELAEQMGTNRNALYKVLHDARKKLLGLLYAEGFTAEDLSLKPLKE